MKFITAIVIDGKHSVEATIESDSIALYFTPPANKEIVVVQFFSGKTVELFADKGALDAIMNVKE